MNDIDLFYPDVYVELGSYGLSEGIEIEAYSSMDSYFDWAKIRFTEQFQDHISVSRKDPALIELGYNNSFEDVFQGYVVSPYSTGSNQHEIVLKDEMILLEETIITNTFLQTTPQEILKFCLNKAGVTDMRISSKVYPKKPTVPVFRKNVISVIETIHSIWKIQEPFFFSSGVFYWGEQPEQDKIYEFEYAENIISLERSGGLWVLETISAPWVRHSHKIKVIHPKVSGEVTVKKVIFTTEASGFIRTRIYF
ncbi:serine/arginine repetitive matrix protein 2 [Paenibacillus sp. M1]|uniref:Serine/arginine repetitive matrix protein 2 n=1 Tax=Paenibacillus haidiansis TaxID=1574488 RepID=A0ABU7VX68_9BACL